MTSVAAQEGSGRRRPRVSLVTVSRVAFVMFVLDVLVLFWLGFELLATAPPHETLGQGFIAFLLLAGTALLVPAALLAVRIPRVVGLALLAVGVPLFVEMASESPSASDWMQDDPARWRPYSPKQLDPLLAVIADSRPLTLLLFLIPPVAGLLLLVAGKPRLRETRLGKTFA